MKFSDEILLYLYDFAQTQPMVHVPHDRLYSQLNQPQGRLTGTEFTAALRFLVGKKHIQEEAAYYRITSDGEEYAYNLRHPPTNYEEKALEETKKGNNQNLWFFLGSAVLTCVSIWVAIIYGNYRPEHASSEDSIQNYKQQEKVPTVVYLTPTTAQLGFSKTEPVDFVASYWKNVSDGNLETAWTQLSPSFRQNKHNNNYDDYVSGYQKMHLCRIDASKLALEQGGDTNAVVKAHITYYVGQQCSPYEYDFEILLVYDSVTNSWLYDQTTVLQR